MRRNVAFMSKASPFSFGPQILPTAFSSLKSQIFTYFTHHLHSDLTLHSPEYCYRWDGILLNKSCCYGPLCAILLLLSVGLFSLFLRRRCGWNCQFLLWQKVPHPSDSPGNTGSSLLTLLKTAIFQLFLPVAPTYQKY